MFTVEHKGDVIVNVSTTIHDNTVGLSDMTGIMVGMYLAAAGVPLGAYVTKLDTNASTVEISAAATATGTVSGNFSRRPEVLSGMVFGMDKDNYGGNHASYTPPQAEQDVEIRVVQDTNGAGAVRLYVHANGAWNYVSMTKV